MKKYQWYVFSAVSLFLMLILGGFARGRKNWCLSIYPEMGGLYPQCLQRAGFWMLIGIILFILAIVFLILGILEKSK